MSNVLAAAGPTGFPTPTPDPNRITGKGQQITLKVEKARLETVLRFISQATMVEFHVQPRFDPMVSINVFAVPWDGALRKLLEPYDAELYWMGRWCYIGPRKQIAAFREHWTPLTARKPSQTKAKVPEGEPFYSGLPVSIDWSFRTLYMTLKQWEPEIHQTFHFPREVLLSHRDRSLNIMMMGAPWDLVLDFVLLKHGLYRTKKGNVITLLAEPPAPTPTPAPTSTPDPAKKDAQNEYLDRPMSMAQRISVNFQNADLHHVLYWFAQKTSFNLVLDTDIPNEKVNIHLKDVPWDQAFDIILRTHGLVRDLEGNVLWVGTRKSFIGN